MKIFTIGGYSEVGKNMTVVQIGDDVIIFDCGLHLPPIVELEERNNIVLTERKLRKLGAIPQDTLLDSHGLRSKVRAMLIGHAHLDHVGAVPYIAGRYNADVIGTPFTIAVLKTLMRDEDIKLNNKIKEVQPNSSISIRGNKNYRVEFVNITHSTPQTSMIALHTPEGVVLYANDFKFDNFPQLGKKPNYEALRRIAKEGVKVLIVESLYASEERKTPSEKIARDLLEDVLLGVDNKNASILVTTFSSHIARLRSIVDMGKKLNRKIVFIGRSLRKYVSAAIKTNLCPFKKSISLLSYRKQISGALKKINKNKQDYLVACTGHQGEPGAVLDRISRNDLPLQLSDRDHVIFSSSTIPAEINIANKAQLEKRLKNRGVRIFNNVHVSGHAGREDLRDFINMVQPEHIIPAHGDLSKLTALAELAGELGYKIGKDCHIMQNLQKVEI
jgi:ribonuclease J